MGTRWGRAPWSALLVVVWVVVLVCVQSSPAAAATLIALTGDGSDWGTTSGNPICDSDDSTNDNFTASLSSSGWNITYCKTVSGTAGPVAAVRVKMDTAAGGYVTTACSSGGSAGTAGPRVPVSGNFASGVYDSGVVSFTSQSLTNWTSCSRIRYDFHWPGGGGSYTYRWYVANAYSDTTATVGVETYCFNMNVQHPWLAWDVFCNFRYDLGFHGTVAVSYDGSSPSFYLESCAQYGLTGCDSTAYTTSLSLSPTSGFGGGTPGSPTVLWLRQKCSVLGCASDHATITITDTDRDQTASYTFSRADSGAVQTPTSRPQLTMFRGCYNASTNQCHGVDAAFPNGASGTASFKWQWSQGTTAAATGGKFSSMKANGLPNLTSTGSWTDGSESAGTVYGAAVTAASSGVWGIVIQNGAGATWGSVDIAVDNTTGAVTGADYPSGSDVFQTSVCDVQHLDGCFRNLFGTSPGSIYGAVVGPIGDVWSTLKTKQPFSFIDRASVGVGGQLARAAAATSSTTTCAGVAMVMPSLPAPSFANTWAIPTPGPYFQGTATPGPNVSVGSGTATFTVLRCADLDPVFGSTWWQTFDHYFLEPGLVLLFAYRELKRLQPKAVLAG